MLVACRVGIRKWKLRDVTAESLESHSGHQSWSSSSGLSLKSVLFAAPENKDISFNVDSFSPGLRKTSSLFIPR